MSYASGINCLDWDKLYRLLAETSASLDVPDTDASAEGLSQALFLASDALSTLSTMWIKFSGYKRETKNALRTIELTVEVESALVGYSKAKNREVYFKTYPDKYHLLDDCKAAYEDVQTFMEAIAKTLSRVKYFREDIGRRIKLLEIEGTNYGSL